MLTLAASLLGHQRAAMRRPALKVELSQTRFAVPVWPWSFPGSAGADAPVDAAYNPPTAKVVRVRNNAGALNSDIDFAATWAVAVDTVTAGQGFAIRYDTVNARLGLAYGDGLDLKFRTSTDGGASWAAPAVLVTEAAAIGSVALAFDTTGDACAFYTLGTTTTLKRLRRTAGVWAGAGTNWSKSGSVASLTGLSAIWKNDYYLVLTGTEVTTTHERCWSVAMGDTVLPANAWSALIPIAESDAAAALTFAHPHLASDSAGNVYATFVAQEAGNVAATRTHYTTTNAALDPLSPWREPYPLNIDSAYGCALAVTGSTGMTAASAIEKATAPARTARDLSAAVLSCRWRETPGSLDVRVELDDPVGTLLSGSTALPMVGTDLRLSLGYLSGTAGAAQYGATLLANIHRVSRRLEPGRCVLVIEAGGPWEQMARYRAPQAWTAPTGTTPGAIFQRIAGRAGLTVTDAAAPIAPSTAWTTDTPDFAIAPGEAAAATLRRLLAPTEDFLRIRADTGGFQVCGLTFGAAVSATASYGLVPSASFPHQWLAMTRSKEHEPNWTRLEAKDRYADRFAFNVAEFEAALGTTEDWPFEPLYQLVRDVDITADAAANAAALASMKRAQHLAVLGELVVPLHAGHELYDVAETDAPAAYDDPFGAGRDYRVIGLGGDYRRGPAAGSAGPAYNSVLTLGRP